MREGNIKRSNKRNEKRQTQVGRNGKIKDEPVRTSFSPRLHPGPSHVTLPCRKTRQQQLDNDRGRSFTFSAPAPYPVAATAQVWGLSCRWRGMGSTTQPTTRRHPFLPFQVAVLLRYPLPGILCKVLEWGLTVNSAGRQLYVVKGYGDIRHRWLRGWRCTTED